MADIIKDVIIPKTIKSPAKVFTQNVGTGRSPTLNWEVPEYDFAECGRIIDVESYARRALRNKKNLFVKEGYSFVGANQDKVKYIKTRFKQFELATGIPTSVLMGQTIASLIRTSNAFWVKVRNKTASGGIPRVTPEGKTLNPIAGYFIMAPETVLFKRDENGTIVKYLQEIRGKQKKEFEPHDVIHFYFDKREGRSVGTPVLVSVKDDIRALRRIEEHVELLVHQHLFPLFHYKVGTEQRPAQTYPDGRTEVDEIQLKVAMMPSDGCWITPERHEIKAINTSASPVAVEKVIEHYKQRIFTGLGNSSVDMGEGGTASRSTAQTMSRNLVDDTKADQKEFASQFEAFVIRELLLESTFDDDYLLNEEESVKLQFNEIDFESKIAKENHLTDLFLKNVITHDELRIGMGLEVFVGNGWPTSSGDGDWGRTNYGLIDRDKFILQSLDEPGTSASKEEAASRTAANKVKAIGPTAGSAGGNAVANKNTPSNQHGTRSAPKINKDSFEDKQNIPSLNIIFNQESPLKTLYNNLKDDVVIYIKRNGYQHEPIKLLVGSAFGQAKERLSLFSKRAFRIGLNDANLPIGSINLTDSDVIIYRHVEKYVDRLYNQLIEQFNANIFEASAKESLQLVMLVFDALEHRTSMIDNSEIVRAYNYGKAIGLRTNKQQFKTQNESNCESCNSRILMNKNTDAIIYEELPPFHPNCSCRIVQD